VRIAFINEFGNAINIPKTPEDIKYIERVIDFIFGGKSYLRYGKSFGGHCLPKDTLAFQGMMSKKGIEPNLIRGVIHSNDLHGVLHSQNGVVKEWFSEWEKSEISGRVALKSLVKAIKRRVVG
jgi:UDP-glucose 6-dehydrogenase